MKDVRRAGTVPLPGTGLCRVHRVSHRVGSFHTGNTDRGRHRQLPEQPSHAAIELPLYVPLLKLLDHSTTTRGLDASKTAGLPTTPTIYADVNRLLERIPKPTGVVS
ncbi:hypothetical protein PI125_g2943 [Phytophthora idaei]|nr:hypothetical protein PI125_g2943 [Phytophthora idaei]